MKQRHHPVPEGLWAAGGAPTAGRLPERASGMLRGPGVLEETALPDSSPPAALALSPGWEEQTHRALPAGATGLSVPARGSGGGSLAGSPSAAPAAAAPRAPPAAGGTAGAGTLGGNRTL